MLCALGLLLTQLWSLSSAWIFGPEEVAVQNWISPSAGSQSVWMPVLASPTTELPHSIWQRFLFPVYHWLSNPTLNETAFCISSMIGIIAIWTFIGGCLTRRSVVELGTNMTAPWAETIQLVLKRWQSIAWSVTMPSGLILMLGLVPLALGWLSNIPWIGEWFAGLLLVPVVLLSIGLGWCAAITLFGFPLSVCSIVTEKGADAYDGISRSAAYTFQRPLTLALCVVAAGFLSAIGGTFLAIVLTTGFQVVEAGFDIGSFSSLEKLESMWGPILRGIVPLLLTAYGFSFFWTAASATYLILRREVDHAEFDLIDMGDVLTKSLPELPTKDAIVPPSDPDLANTAE